MNLLVYQRRIYSFDFHKIPELIKINVNFIIIKTQLHNVVGTYVF